MSILTCAEVRELAPELALGVLGGPERAETIAHVNACVRCQAYVAELTEAADALPQLAPQIEPPAGFEHRVLAGMRAGRRHGQRRWIASLAAVAAAVAILSVTAVRIIESGDSTTTPAAHVASPVAVTMEGTATGAPAGWAYVSGQHVVAVMVSYGAASGDYQVQATAPGGAPETLGTMTVADNRGSWTGRSVSPITSGVTISLVDAAGNPVCHGTVPA
jgi:hypothetical protein